MAEVGVQNVIDFLMELKTEKPDKVKLIEEAIELVAEAHPKCYYCKWYNVRWGLEECKHPDHDIYDGTYGYFCSGFELNEIYAR